MTDFADWKVWDVGFARVTPDQCKSMAENQRRYWSDGEMTERMIGSVYGMQRSPLTPRRARAMFRVLSIMGWAVVAAIAIWLYYLVTP